VSNIVPRTAWVTVPNRFFNDSALGMSSAPPGPRPNARNWRVASAIRRLLRQLLPLFLQRLHLLSVRLPVRGDLTADRPLTTTHVQQVVLEAQPAGDVLRPGDPLLDQRGDLVELAQLPLEVVDVLGAVKAAADDGVEPAVAHLRGRACLPGDLFHAWWFGEVAVWAALERERLLKRGVVPQPGRRTRLRRVGHHQPELFLRQVAGAFPRLLHTIRRVFDHEPEEPVDGLAGGVRGFLNLPDRGVALVDRFGRTGERGGDALNCAADRVDAAFLVGRIVEPRL
jgi:hypothetical protein